MRAKPLATVGSTQCYPKFAMIAISSGIAGPFCIAAVFLHVHTQIQSEVLSRAVAQTSQQDHAAALVGASRA